MMKTFAVFHIVISCAVASSGCDNTFTPDGPYREKLVVFSVLSTRSDTQFVRVHTTLRSPVVSEETHVPDAQVTITQGDSVFQLRDTTLERSDTSLYTTRIKAYVTYALHLQAGLRYDLSVVSPSHGNVSSHATSLFRGTLLPETDLAGGIAARIYPGANARAHIVRLYLEYEVQEESVWVPGKTEIPSYVGEAGEYVYPRPVSRANIRAVFGASGYASVVSQLRRQYPGGKLRLKRTRFVLTQLDDWFYAYYSTANGFPDSGTLRLDEPDYTNIEGGFGVFGMSSETVAVADTSGHAITHP